MVEKADWIDGFFKEFLKDFDKDLKAVYSFIKLIFQLLFIHNNHVIVVLSIRKSINAFVLFFEKLLIFSLHLEICSMIQMILDESAWRRLYS